MTARRLAALVAAVALVLAACGDADDTASDVGDDTESVDPSADETGDAGETGDAVESTATDEPAEDGPPATGATGDPAVDFVVLEPVALAEPSAIGDGLVVSVLRIDDVDLDAQGIGETAGPGVAVVVEIRNDRDAPVDVNGVVVNGTVRGDVPATPNFSAPYAPFEGELAPGASATATFPFRIDPADRESLVIDIHHDGSPNVVVVEAGS